MIYRHLASKRFHPTKCTEGTSVSRNNHTLRFINGR